MDTNDSPHESPAPPRAKHLDPEDLARLQDTLKRCPPATLEAACAFYRTGDCVYLTPIVLGVIERYVEREFRAKLRDSTDNLRLVEDLGIDSLTMMEIVLMAEDVLKISVSNDELTSLRTIGDVRNFIAQKVGGAT